MHDLSVVHVEHVFAVQSLPFLHAELSWQLPGTHAPAAQRYEAAPESPPQQLSDSSPQQHP